MLKVANTYGSTAHLSPLLRKTRRLGLLTADSLLHLAVARGCEHYTPANYCAEMVGDPGLERLTDTELGIAMISGAQDYDPQRMRCAAQLLSGPQVNANALVRLAKMERCGPVLGYIAAQARRWDEGRESFWASVEAMLPRSIAMQPPESWPHPSRFMLNAGYRRGGGVSKPVWLRPKSPKSA
jgi:hypothetical protein